VRFNGETHCFEMATQDRENEKGNAPYDEIARDAKTRRPEQGSGRVNNRCNAPLTPPMVEPTLHAAVQTT